MINVLIIENDVASRKNIDDLLKRYNYCSETFIKIETKLGSIRDSIIWFKNNKSPDLVFLNIRLSDGLCFEIFNKIKINCPIIFTTVNDEYIINTFKTNNINYLLKPIALNFFDRSIDEFFKLKKSNINQLIINNKLHFLDFSNQKKHKERFLVKLGNKYTPIKIENIAYFYKDDIVFIKCFSGDSYPISSSLSTIETKLDIHLFFRANRKILVNINAIDYLAQYKPGQFTIKVSPKFEEIIILSQEKSSRLKLLLNY